MKEILLMWLAYLGFTIAIIPITILLSLTAFIKLFKNTPKPIEDKPNKPNKLKIVRDEK